MNRYVNGKKPELLAPAGSMEGLRAAVQNGCDAVYLGGKAFGARATAANFERDGMQEALRYAHLYGVRVYVTVNTLYKDQELPSLLEFIGDLYADGADGVILQDLGAARMIRQVYPDLEVHASTQMTVHNLDGARYLAEMGFTRVVLARELELGEIQEIAAHAPIEAETFIHGALCVCYSGQCLMSSLIGGRSGNRGRCAQPCRLPYQLVDREAGTAVASVSGPRYLLSPKDISTLEILPELIKAGIASFKLEGRLKRPEYTASVTRIYRKYLDLALQNPQGYRLERADLEEVTQIFNRGGFSTGYYTGKTGRSMMSFERPKNWGIQVGEVLAYDPARNECKVKLTGELEDGDGVEIWTGEEDHPGTTVRILRQAGNVVTFTVKGAVRRGNPVYRTSRKSLLDELAASFADYRRKIDVYGKIHLQPGRVVTLHLWDQDGNYVAVQSVEAAERAQKQPVTSEKVKEQLSKMGDVPFQLAEMAVEMEEDLFLPISRLNALRREAVERLAAERIRRFGGSRRIKQRRPEVPEVVRTGMVRISAGDRTEASGGEEQQGGVGAGTALAIYLEGEQFAPERFIELGAERLYLNLHTLSPERVTALKAVGGDTVQLFGVLPRIARNRQLEQVRRQIRQLMDSPLDGFLVGNLGEAQVLKELGLLRQECEEAGDRRAGKAMKCIADFPLNLMNRLTLDHWADAGMDCGVLSPELTLREMEELIQWGALGKEAIVYGHLPSMISEYCPVGAVEGGMTARRGCSRPERNRYGLLDRLGHIFPILTDCRHCRSVILNPQPVFLLEQLEQILRSGFSVLRMNLTIEREEDGLAIAAAYLQRMQQPAAPLTGGMRELVKRMQDQGFTKGHFYRGVE